MPTKSSSGRRKKQQGKNRAKSGVQAEIQRLAAEEKALAARRRALQKQQKSERQRAKRTASKGQRAAKATQRAISRHARTRRQTVRDLQELTDLGFYEPRKPIRRNKKGLVKFTADQGKYIRRRARKLRSFIAEHVAVKPKGPPATRRKTLRAAKRAGYDVSDKAIFVPAEGVEKVKLRRDRKTGRPELVEIKSYETNVIPLASFDELEAEKERIRRLFNWHARRNPGKRLRFYIEGKWGSHATFAGDEFEKLWDEMLTSGKLRGGFGRAYARSRRLKIGIAERRRNKGRTIEDKRLGRGIDKKGKSRR